jgi:MFS transporter, DHA1 family, multidrug resistance protein
MPAVNVEWPSSIDGATRTAAPRTRRPGLGVERSMRRRWSWRLGLSRELGNVFWAMVGLEASYGAYSGIWPLWIEHLGAPVAIVGLMLGASGVLRLLVIAPSAALGERFPARNLILIARSFTLVGMASAALATHWPQLFVLVAGGAIGEITFPLIQSHASEHAAANRVRAFTLVFNVGPAVAFGVAPLISGAAIALWGMRAAFLLGAAYTALSMFFFSRLSRGERVHHDDRPQSTYREALAHPGVRRLLALQFATIFSLSLGISLLPNFLADVRGFAPATVAILAGIGSFGSVMFGLTVARSPFLQRSPFLAAALASLGVIVTLAVCATSAAQLPIVVAFLGRGGLWSAWGLFVAGLSEVVGDGPHRARSFALSEMLGGTAFFSAPMLAGVLYDVAPVVPILASIVMALTMAPILLWSQRRLSLGRIGRPPVEPEPI